MSKGCSSYSQRRNRSADSFCSKGSRNMLSGGPSLLESSYSHRNSGGSSAVSMAHGRRRNQQKHFASPPPSDIEQVNKRARRSCARRNEILPLDEEWLVVESTDPLGPEPDELSKRLFESGGSPLLSRGSEPFSGSRCVQSPSPSSLPLPRLWVGCKAEAGGGGTIYAGATNHLRCLLGI